MRAELVTSILNKVNRQATEKVSQPVLKDWEIINVVASLKISLREQYRQISYYCKI